jgi:DNA-binding NtrC family response regulator
MFRNKDQSTDILVVDDDRALNNMICKYLEKHGFRNIFPFYTGEELLESINRFDAPIVIQDFELPGINGVEVLQKVKSIRPNAEFIFLSGQSSIDVAVDSIKYGAFDYIIKDNFAKENVITKIRNLIKIKNLVKDRSSFRIILLIILGLLLISWGYLIIYKLGIFKVG